MIEFLKISSMAIFDEIEIDFKKGLNCITGETGAGKSLILGALTLLMGAKASRDLVRPGNEKTSIEALFNISGKEMVLRREIYTSGSNRCYIDGKLSTVTNLADISSGLIHIYGQHEYQDLLNPSEHMRILEDLAGIKRDDLISAYENLVTAKKKLAEIEKQIEQSRIEKEDLIYSFEELKSTLIEDGLEEKLVSELNLLYASADLQKSALMVQDILYSGNPSVLDLATEAKQHILKIASHDKTQEKLVKVIEDVIIQLEDIMLCLRERSSCYEQDPDKIEKLENTVHTLKDLKHKYKTNENGLIKLRDDFKKRLTLLEDPETIIEDVKKDVEKTLNIYKNCVQDILEKRHSFALNFCKGINTDLHDLGMPGTQFFIQQMDTEKMDDALVDNNGNIISPNTLLKGEFLIATNIGQHTLPLTKIASGGELSRVMLALKVQQKTSQDATVVFDEIDSGISGQTAFMIANKLKDLSTHTQAIVVTHLHQVASLADSHFVISKRQSENTTISTVKSVNKMERVMELARMMGGESPSSTVIKHAKELVK